MPNTRLWVLNDRWPVGAGDETLASTAVFERGVEVDHVTIYRWFVDETYVRVGGVWRDEKHRVGPALLQHGAGRSRPTRGGHAFIRNLRRGHYELGVNARPHHLRVAAAFDELATAI